MMLPIAKKKLGEACLPNLSNVGKACLPDPRRLDLAPTKSKEYVCGGQPSPK